VAQASVLFVWASKKILGIVGGLMNIAERSLRIQIIEKRDNDFINLQLSQFSLKISTLSKD